MLVFADIQQFELVQFLQLGCVLLLTANTTCTERKISRFQAAFRLKIPLRSQIMLDCADVKAESQLNFLLGSLAFFFPCRSPLLQQTHCLK